MAARKDNLPSSGGVVFIGARYRFVIEDGFFKRGDRRRRFSAACERDAVIEKAIRQTVSFAEVGAVGIENRLLRR
jgi:hypothetical protein